MYFNEENNNTNLDYEFNNKKNTNFKINYKYLLIGITIIMIIIIAITLSKRTLKTETYLVLNGDTDIIINQHDSYVDYGFKAYDNHGNDLSNKVIVSGEVNNEVVGEYTITYTLGNLIKTRTISVITQINQVTYLILNGPASIFLKVGDTYQEPGYTVIDNLENNLTNKVTVSGKVDPTKVGTYKLKYSITNRSNTTITEERTVIVMDSNININYTPTNITNQNITINVDVTDNYFDYILLPDGTRSINRKATYKVTENNSYKFTIYSKDGSSKEQIIKIENIDKQAPSGTCSGYYKNGNSYITIDAKDNLGISKYQINNETFTNNQITYNKEINNVKIQIYDKANNITNISCNLTNKNPVILPSSSSKKSSNYSSSKSSGETLKPSSGNNYPQSPTASNDLKVYYFTASNGDKMSYWLYVPSGYSSNMPMIVFLHGQGEAGNDYVNKTTNAIYWGFGRDISKRNAKFNAIILIPQAKESWNTTTLKNVIEISNQVANQYRVDKQRISIVGFSLGCIAIPDILGLYPNYFSAAVPIECKRPTDTTAARKYGKIPTWTFASQDYTHTALQTLTRNINNVGGNAKHSYYPGLGHTGLVGNKGYSIFTDSKINLVSWITSQRK